MELRSLLQKPTSQPTYQWYVVIFWLLVDRSNERRKKKRFYLRRSFALLELLQLALSLARKVYAMVRKRGPNMNFCSLPRGSQQLKKRCRSFKSIERDLLAWLLSNKTAINAKEEEKISMTSL